MPVPWLADANGKKAPKSMAAIPEFSAEISWLVWYKKTQWEDWQVYVHLCMANEPRPEWDQRQLHKIEAITAQPANMLSSGVARQLAKELVDQMRTEPRSSWSTNEANASVATQTPAGGASKVIYFSTKSKVLLHTLVCIPSCDAMLDG